MFSQTRKAPPGDSEPRRRGRPSGPTEQGRAARRQLYEVAVRLIAAQGYEATTLRDIAREAGVSPGLLYRYFPSKRAVVLALYDELSAAYAERAASMEPGPWRERFLYAVRASLEVLGPKRKALGALSGVLLGFGDDGLFASTTAFSRLRVQSVFTRAVCEASDAPEGATAEALGRLLYVAHLGLILWWLLDKSPEQRATRDLWQLLENTLPWASVLIGTEVASEVVLLADELCREAIFGEVVEV